MSYSSNEKKVESMNTHENQSEVARLLERIELEYEAAQRALTGLACGTSKHAFITDKMERIGNCHASLKQLVGEDEATRLMADTLENL